MKNFLAIFTFWLIIVQAGAQVPDKFSFQGVAKNATGQVLAAGTNVKVRFTIHAGGQTVYQETHLLNVGAGGIFNAAIGDGDVISGSFHDIAWHSVAYFMQVEIDTDGGDNFVDVGTSQLLSVPYSLHSKTADSWKQDETIIHKGVINLGKPIESIGSGARLFWFPARAAFRAGSSNNGTWENDRVGLGSFAVGGGTTAEGTSSAAFGSATKALGFYSAAFGNNTLAQGGSSASFGLFSQAHGVASFAAGESTITKAFASVAFGGYNDVSDSPDDSKNGAVPTDRIFQIGNGTAENSRSNAVTILRNGNVGIGGNVTNPDNILEVGGRARIRNSASTAGIYFDNQQNSPVGFVGMKNNVEVGFYNENNWIFYCSPTAASVNGSLFVSGSVYVSGSVFESDRRLKTSITGIGNTLGKLTKLMGYNYYWKSEKKDKELQTGVIAQEVEEIFPELVKTDEKGFKSVNYIGFIPHLIESVKELKRENEQLKADNSAMKNETNKKLETLEARLNQLLVKPEISGSK